VRTKIATLVVVLMVLACPIGAADRGFFGFGLRTDFDGSFWSPVLASASISLVAPDSPTAKSGITLGDTLIEIEGLLIPGAKDEHLKKIKAILEKDARVGDQLHLKLRRNTGQEYSVTLTAEPRKE
jgi:C-terminal processing protease CtpA/Prc